MKLPRAAAAVFAALSIGAFTSSADVLYSTDFENFSPGPDNLVGTDDWVSTRNGESLHGIDDEIIAGIGNSAYLGFFPPASAQVRTISVFRPMNYDAVAEGKPIIEFEALIAIADSQDDETTQFIDESMRADRFLITIYNIAGQQLASIIYDNRTNTYGLYRNALPLSACPSSRGHHF